MKRWSNLFLFSAERDAIIATLQTALQELGYTLYNPFGGMPGLAYPQTVKLFVSPPEGDIIRIIGEPINELLPPLSQCGLCLMLSFDEESASIMLYQHGQETSLQALAPYLREGKTLADVEAALNNTPIVDDEHEHLSDVPLTALPEDMQTLAQGVNPQEADKLFQRFAGKLLRNDEERAAAQALLKPQSPNWNSVGGRQAMAIMSCLPVSSNWHQPDFITLRDAYQLHARRQRRPQAKLLPGDAEAMAAVPNALEYVPIYGGK
ncbi:MAG: hypothetical protein D6712_15155 [Chloroflexi bacterium]|nr:MAG: hypothetical protein D6712_15155 [Chloroflexota bacterium]